MTSKNIELLRVILKNSINQGKVTFAGVAAKNSVSVEIAPADLEGADETHPAREFLSTADYIAFISLDNAKGQKKDKSKGFYLAGFVAENTEAGLGRAVAVSLNGDTPDVQSVDIAHVDATDVRELLESERVNRHVGYLVFRTLANVDKS